MCKVLFVDCINFFVIVFVMLLFDFYVDNFMSDLKFVRVGLSYGTSSGSSAYNLGD